MAKLRITVVAVHEYETTDENYPGCTTAEEMLALDLANANDDPLEFAGYASNITVTGEVLPT